jgi:hypothetical protein
LRKVYNGMSAVRRLASVVPMSIDRPTE